MRLISIDHAKEKMAIARTIYAADGNILLAQGVLLNNRYINRLRELGIASIYIIDDLVGEIHVEDLVKEQTRNEAFKATKEAMLCIRSDRSMDGQKVRNAVNDVMEDLLLSKDVMVNLTDIRAMNDYTFGHNVSVAVLSLMTGIAIGYDFNKLKVLGTGAILHDVGKAKISDLILNKPGKLTDQEFFEVQKHSQFGFDILRKCNDINIVSAHIAWQHHEKFDGTGYPRKLAGEQIHEFARITAIADVYDALSTDRIYRSKLMPSEIIEIIRNSSGDQFDPEITRIFIRHIAPFPLGSRVLLNNGETAAVIKITKDLPDRPVVKVILDKHGQPLTDSFERDLTKDLTVLIEKPIRE